MATDAELAQDCVNCYVAPLNFNKVVYQNGVWVGIKMHPVGMVLAFRGSDNIPDWLRDFDAEEYNDDELGRVPAGAMIGLKQLAANPPRVQCPLYITGHSLGAWHACLFAALLMARGITVTKVVGLGTPKVGGSKITQLLAPVEVNLYKNRFDPVCDVPIDLPGLEPYEHPRTLIPLNEPPAIPDEWGLLSDHHSELYLRGIQKLCPAS